MDETDQIVSAVNYLGHPTEVAFRGAAGGPGMAGGLAAPNTTAAGQTPVTQATPQFWDQLFNGNAPGGSATGSPGNEGGAGQSFTPGVTGATWADLFSGGKQGLMGMLGNDLASMMGIDPNISLFGLNVNPVNIAGRALASMLGIPGSLANTIFGALLGGARGQTASGAVGEGVGLSPADIELALNALGFASTAAGGVGTIGGAPTGLGQFGGIAATGGNQTVNITGGPQGEGGDDGSGESGEGGSGGESGGP